LKVYEWVQTMVILDEKLGNIIRNIIYTIVATVFVQISWKLVRKVCFDDF
jgi:hypothetical protein